MIGDEIEDIQPGDIFEDCGFHPVLCTERLEDDRVHGINLLDGSWSIACSLYHCGVVRLTVDQTVAIRNDPLGYAERRWEGGLSVEDALQ